MILYHTSSLEIQKPNVSFSRDRLDFGKGFYLTPLKEQAILYGQRFIKRGEEAFLNTYELEENIEDCKYKVFTFDCHKLCEYPVTFTNGTNTDTIIRAEDNAPKILNINLFFIFPLLSYYLIISNIKKITRQKKRLFVS